ncbi:MAG TPA: PLP-dependent aminotransferase family protein [Azospirillaceae bacterium]|nr:PLP-dependent aminotransferase family protein [Azospirillaceae bacterium]
MARRRAEAQWRPVIDGTARPIYLALADALERDVAAGRLQPGQTLPTHRALATALGLDLTTVTRAYGEARRRGLVGAATGRGSFVAEHAARAAGPSKVEVDLSMNLPPHPPAAGIAERLARTAASVLGRPDLARLLSYHPSAGLAEDREAGAAWLAPLLPGLAPDRVLVSGGAQAALMALLSSLAGSGDTVLAEEFTYPGLKAAAAQMGLRLEGLPMDAEGLLPDALEDACRRLSPRALYCVPTIQNPTAGTLSPGRRAAVAAIARAHGLAIVEDDAYGLLPAVPPAPIASLVPELTWYISTLSKCLFPGLRIAYVAAPDERAAARAQTALRATLQMAPPLSAAIATRWVRDGSAAAVLEAVRAEARARQHLARAHLPAAAAHPEGHHLWLRLPPSWSAPAFADEARRAGLSVVPGAAFAIGAPRCEAVRLSLGAASDRAALDRALARLGALAEEGAGALLHIV